MVDPQTPPYPQPCTNMTNNGSICFQNDSCYHFLNHTTHGLKTVSPLGATNVSRLQVHCPQVKTITPKHFGSSLWPDICIRMQINVKKSN